MVKSSTIRYPLSTNTHQTMKKQNFSDKNYSQEFLNEKQDVKNILVLENGSTMRRKEMKVNPLNINALYENLYFPMLARMTIKKT